jgi:hypothetical protein
MTTKQSRAAKAPSPSVPSLLAGINDRALLDIIDGQRMKLYNVLGSLRCLSAVLRDNRNDETGGASRSPPMR